MDVLGIGLSGLQAADARLNVAAGNIANADTPGYQARRADLVELSGGGVGLAGVSRSSAPADLDADGNEGSDVDLATESVDLVQAHVLYTANAAVIRAGNQMYGTLLDMLDHDPDRDADR